MKKNWAGKNSPELADEWFKFYKIVTNNGVLDKKTKELIAVAAGSIAR